MPTWIARGPKAEVEWEPYQAYFMIRDVGLWFLLQWIRATDYG